MRPKKILAVAAIVCCGCVWMSCAASRRRVQTARLYSPLAHHHDNSRATLRFIDGSVGAKGDLGYGFFYTNDDHDWFQPSTLDDSRTVIRDLGALNWSDRFNVPAIAPFPTLRPGERRVISVNVSAGEYENWVATNERFFKAVVGHIYVIHVKDTYFDFFALFRVEKLDRGESCTISWKRIGSPK